MTARRLAVVAGAGDLPRRIVDHARATGRRPVVFGLTGFADASLMALEGATEVAVGEFGRLIRMMRDQQCEDVVFAGALKRPDFRSLRLDLTGVQALPRILAAARKGDDALLRAVMDTFADAGFNVVGADDVLGDLRAPTGAVGAHQPSEADWLDIRRAAVAAAAIGALDIGQGAVSCDGLILALEAQEGTDRMLARVAELPEQLRGTSHARRGVLVKRPKPQQERRIDLPTIGAATIIAAAEAGLAGVAVEAGGALIVDRDQVARTADSLGLFVYGFTPDQLA